MHTKPDLRVFLKWMIAGSGSVITDVIPLAVFPEDSAIVTTLVSSHRVKMSDHPFPHTLAPWWALFTDNESRECRSEPDGACPELEIGTMVRLTGKPELKRRVIGAEWHSHRYEFVYIVETSAEGWFRPYWFLAQLTVVGPPANASTPN